MNSFLVDSRVEAGARPRTSPGSGLGKPSIAKYGTLRVLLFSLIVSLFYIIATLEAKSLSS